LQATNITAADVVKLADDRPGVRGRGRLLSALALVDPGAESPQETRLRLLLVRGGLPSPETQIRFRTRSGRHIRVDMGWREWKVAVEYDGVQHWADADQHSWDIDRIAILESMGWVVVRVSAEMFSRPSVILQRVMDKLRQAGWPG
jgi:very-short-patch-repair endonuclease